jgi:diguanylate cyclase (GGDEF)-like protein
MGAPRRHLARAAEPLAHPLTDRPRAIVLGSDAVRLPSLEAVAEPLGDDASTVSAVGSRELNEPWVDDTRRVLADRRRERSDTTADAGEVPDRPELSVADRVSAYVLGGSFAMLAVVLAIMSTNWSESVVERAVVGAVALVVATRVQFESGPGSAVATQPILVVLVFLLPLEIVPLVVLVSAMAGDTAWIRARHRSRDLMVSAATGWHCVGPVAVLSVAGVDRPGVDQVLVLVAALLAQFAIDFAVGAVRCRVLGIPLTDLARALAWSFSVDTLLAPIGVAAVLATDANVGAIAFALAPVGLLALMSRDRAEQFERAVALTEVVDEAVAQARLDPLTGLSNRRAWNEAIARVALRQAVEHELRVVVLLGDLDGLKHVNDELGHEAGDRLIKAAAEVLRAVAPAGAVVARLGGDEFGVLIADPGTIDASQLVAITRRRIAAHPRLINNVRLSLSVGAASCPPIRSVEAAVIAADELVFADKRERAAGRS